MKKIYYILLALLLVFPTIVFGAVTQPINGGTGSTTLTGILFGNGTMPVSTLTVGTGLTFSGSTLNSVWTTSGSNIYNNNTGNVGIGTTNPLYKLQIGDSSHVATNAFYIQGGDTGGGSKIINAVDYYGNPAFQISGDKTAYFSGNVGIGVTNPGYPLTVNGTAQVGSVSNSGYITMGQWAGGTGYGAIYFNQSSPGAGNYAFLGNSTDTYFNAASAMHFRINNNSNPDAMYIDSTGNVAIGGGANQNTLNLSRSGALNTTPGVDFMSTINSSTATLYNSGRIYGTFGSTGYATGRVTIASPIGPNSFQDVLSVVNGSVGIGTTSPSSLLSVAGASLFHGAITQDTTSTSTFSGGIVASCFSTNGTSCITGSSGTVTSITAGTGLSGGTITTSGTITNPNIIGSGTTGQFPYYVTKGTTLTATSSLFLTPASTVDIGTTTTNVAALTIAPLKPGNAGLVIQGVQSQSSDLLDVNNNAGTTYLSVNAAGTLNGYQQIQFNGPTYAQFQDTTSGAGMDFKTVSGTGDITFTPNANTLLSLLHNGELKVGGGTPTMGTCGTSPSVSGTDNVGTVTVGSGVVTSCAVVYSTTKLATPHVFVSVDGATAIASTISAHSTSGFTVTFASTLGSGTFDYWVVSN